MGTSAIHDRVAHHVAATRFPFPNQTNWPANFITLVNADSQTRAVSTPQGEVYPDIVIIDDAGVVHELGEVEERVSEALADKWQAYAATIAIHPETGVRPFYLYVPAGLEEVARNLLDARGVSYSGVRAFRVLEDDSIEIVPFVTPGMAQDHR